MKLVALLAISVVAVASCKKTPNSATVLMDPIFSDTTVESWGYRTLETGAAQQTDWEIDNFGKASVRYQSIKGLRELKGWENAYYRFTIQEETFTTPEAAATRIERVRDTPPGGHTKKTPHWTLRDGVASGRSAYIVSTDSTKFADEALPSVISHIASHLKTRPTANKRMQATGVPPVPDP
jgi:hypothetical protein